MEGFVQVGVTAMRDPVTLEFLPSVPLYVAAEDAEKLGPGRLVWAGMLGERIRMAGDGMTPHPSASQTPSPQGEGQEREGWADEWGDEEDWKAILRDMRRMAGNAQQ